MNSKSSQTKALLYQLFVIFLGGHANLMFFIVITLPIFSAMNTNGILTIEVNILLRSLLVIILASFATFKFNRIWQNILEKKSLALNKISKIFCDILSFIAPPLIAYLFYGHL